MLAVAAFRNAAAFEGALKRKTPQSFKIAGFFLAVWCPEEDSNLHALQRWYLKPVRLPIPPSGH
jgi:hypothetical protein